MRTTSLLLATLSLSACAALGSEDGSLTRNAGVGACEIVPSGASCTTDADCDDIEECEHGACILDRSDACDDPTAGAACASDADCGAGLECEHGYCAPHGGDDDGASTGGACTTDADCGAGLECEHGACAPHGGGGEDD